MQNMSIIIMPQNINIFGTVKINSAPEEVLEVVFSDADSANENNGSEPETKPSSSEEEDESDLALPNTDQNNARKRGPKTWGVLSRANLHQKKAAEKETERLVLENKLKKEDSRPYILNFTDVSAINAELSNDSTPLDFLDLYLDEEFYEYLTLQTKFYAAQHLQ